MYKIKIKQFWIKDKDYYKIELPSNGLWHYTVVNRNSLNKELKRIWNKYHA